VELQSLLSAEQKKNTEIIAVAPDSLDVIGKMIPKVEAGSDGKIAITLVSDGEHKVIDRYGLLNEKAAERGRIMPHPTTYVIDKTQKVRWKFTEVNFKIRPTNAMILSELGKL
jgi:peroxiredoxin